MLRSAIVRQRLIRCHPSERDAAGRTLMPLVVARRGERWYLLAAPAQADGKAEVDGARMYRLDRLTDLEILRDPAAWPADFDAQAAWAAAADTVESLRNTVSADVLVAPHAAGPMSDVLGVRAVHRSAEPPEPDGRVRLTITAHRVDALAEQLAGWGAVAEVLGPPEVRATLAELGRRLVDHHAPIPGSEVSE